MNPTQSRQPRTISRVRKRLVHKKPRDKDISNASSYGTHIVGEIYGVHCTRGFELNIKQHVRNSIMQQ